MKRRPAPGNETIGRALCGALLFLLIHSGLVFAQEVHPFEISAPSHALSGIPVTITITPEIGAYAAGDSLPVPYEVRGSADGHLFASGEVKLDLLNPPLIEIPDIQIDRTGTTKLQVQLGTSLKQISIDVLPGFLSLLPPILAIFLALITRQVIIALFCGIWVGVTFLNNYNPIWGFLHTIDTYLVNSLADTSHINVLMFSLILGGMVGVITRSGGTQGIVEMLSKYANDSRSGQFATWLMGMFIFFDDYANTLIVGNTMRPLTDKLRISREKLSYLVDSTAAPVANIAIISTWIGYEVGLIDQAFQALEIDSNAYLTFIETVPYNFYPIFTLFFGFFITVTARDYGAMWRAEKRAKSTGKVLADNASPLSEMSTPEMSADENTPKRWYNALVPIVTVIGSVCGGLWYTGWTATVAAGIDLSQMPMIHQVSSIVGNSDPFASLMWSVFIGSICAIAMALGQGLLNLTQALDAWVGGVKSMTIAAIILTAAWAIGNICTDLSTADYVVHITRPILSSEWIPFLVFISAAVIAFSTGTSWGTMAILMPIAIPLASRFAAEGAHSPEHASALLLSSTAAVLAGATFGDHCSPISDTTIMSSMASGADHIDHVKTQLPYALTCGAIACIFGYIPVGFGITDWIVLPAGILTAFLVIRFIGKPTD